MDIIVLHKNGFDELELYESRHGTVGGDNLKEADVRAGTMDK